MDCPHAHSLQRLEASALAVCAHLYANRYLAQGNLFPNGFHTAGMGAWNCSKHAGIFEDYVAKLLFDERTAYTRNRLEKTRSAAALSIEDAWKPARWIHSHVAVAHPIYANSLLSFPSRRKRLGRFTWKGLGTRSGVTNHLLSIARRRKTHRERMRTSYSLSSVYVSVKQRLTHCFGRLHQSSNTLKSPKSPHHAVISSTSASPNVLDLTILPTDAATGAMPSLDMMSGSTSFRNPRTYRFTCSN